MSFGVVGTGGELWDWWAVLAYVAVALLPHIPIKWTVDSLYRRLGHLNDGGDPLLPALVGFVERPLYLGALQMGHGEFIGVWLALRSPGLGAAGRAMRPRSKAGTCSTYSLLALAYPLA